MLVVHHKDLDGDTSAAIVYKAHDRMNMDFHGIDYKDPFPHDKVKEGQTVVIVDFSISPEDMEKLRKKTDHVVWIDHHASAAKLEKQYGGEKLKGLRNFKDKDEAGCELTWRYYFPGKAPLAVQYVGDYDKFSHKLEPKDTQFYEGLKMEDHGPTAELWRSLLSLGGGKADVNRIIENGKTAIKYRDSYCSDICKDFGYETELGGLKCFAANLYRFGSMAYGDRMDKYDACIAYMHDGKQFTVSLYSNKDDVDVSKACEAQGGGGHKGAAGFVCEKLPFEPTSE